MAAIAYAGPHPGVTTTVTRYRDAYAGQSHAVVLRRTQFTNTSSVSTVLRHVRVVTPAGIVHFTPWGRPKVPTADLAVTVDREAFNKAGNGLTFVLTQPSQSSGGGGQRKTEGQLWPR